MSAVFLTNPALADRLAIAGRELAWGSRVDVETMDRLIRRVASRARDTLFTNAMLASVNDDDEGDP